MAGKPRRRSKRVPLSVPVVITGRSAEGARFETSGETLDVNEHGARLRTLEPLPMGARLRVAIVNPYRWRAARVVRCEADPHECGVELEKPGEFWGMYFPPDEWVVKEKPRPAWRREAVVTAPPATPAQASPAPPEIPAVGPSGVLAPGTEVAVSALSLVSSSFQEKTLVLGIDQGYVVMELRRVVNPGSRCRVVVKNHIFVGKIDKVTARPVHGRWGIWVKF